jgi:hypothetical protein
MHKNNNKKSDKKKLNKEVNLIDDLVANFKLFLNVKPNLKEEKWWKKIKKK